ncbi:ZnF_CDGSH domain-containing protein [Durusdinium trenchii]|uniref:ZnF_CDGSH domain-containing protein n=1 Tax=Durusdinium trenchii TaxID=1381693 RepID=A0ABP0RDP3_9DINO
MARAGQPVALNGAELDEEAQRTQQADEDLQLLPDEDADVDLVPGQIRRKSHMRLCKSLQPSEHTVKSKAVKGYLSSIGIAYPVFQRRGTMRKVCVCKSGGFVSLQQLLVTQKDVSCESCAALLSHFGFNADLLADAIQKGLAGEDVFATLPDQQGSEDKKDPIEDGEEREAEQDDDPFDEVKKHQGVVELLPPGTMGKRFPFRCLLCRSGTQPHGRVAELHAAKSKSVKYFLHKHLNSVVAKFATKFLFAKLLGARLFQGTDGVKEVEQEIRESRIFSSDPARAESIMRLSNADLQQFVRNPWLKTPKEWIGENEANFMACVVKPALSLTVTNMPDCFADVISRFAVWMHNKETSETDKANMRVAAGVLQGRLQHHPLLHGIALQSLRMADKHNRGILNMRGRRFMESPLEKKLITDAGLTLATSSGISSLVKMFGISVRECKVTLESLLAESLPHRALAVDWPEVLSENWNLLNQRHPLSEGQNQCRLWMAFDGTYLTPTLSQIQIHERHGLVGGKWSSENKENAFVSLEEDGVDVTATRTPSFLRTIQWGKLWTDTTQARSHGLPPVAYARVNAMSDKLNALLCNPFYLVVDADVAMEDMVVPWSLAGFCVHNVVVALCVAPALHKRMTLKERCSAALAGFLCLDLFQMCAHQTCVKMKLPKGSCFLAPQTVHNLQGTALATVVICATKDTGFEPWSFGHCRLSEISVEEYFGMLRSRSSNSQLSTRGYFYASALQAMRSNHALNKTKRKPEVQNGQSRLTELEPIAGHFS